MPTHPAPSSDFSSREPAPSCGDATQRQAFALDTSGVVAIPKPQGREPIGQWIGYARLSDLDAFTHGYIEALFASSEHPKETYHGRGFRRPVLAGKAPTSSIIAWMPLGFSDLAPETLALILRDCETFHALVSIEFTAEDGRRFWASRQAGFPSHSGSLWTPLFKRNFPPITPYLGADCRVYLRESGQ